MGSYSWGKGEVVLLSKGILRIRFGGLYSGGPTIGGYYRNVMVFSVGNKDLREQSVVNATLRAN